MDRRVFTPAVDILYWFSCLIKILRMKLYCLHLTIVPVPCNFTGISATKRWLLFRKLSRRLRVGVYAWVDERALP